MAKARTEYADEGTMVLNQLKEAEKTLRNLGQEKVDVLQFHKYCFHHMEGSQRNWDWESRPEWLGRNGGHYSKELDKLLEGLIGRGLVKKTGDYIKS